MNMISPDGLKPKRDSAHYI